MQHLETEEKKENDNKKETKMEMEEKEDKMKRKTPDKNLLRNWEGIMNRWSNPTTPNAAGRSRKRRRTRRRKEAEGGQEEEKKQKEEEELCGFVLPQVEVAAGSSSSVEDTISK